MALRELYGLVESYLELQKDNFLAFMQEVETVLFWDKPIY